MTSLLYEGDPEQITAWLRANDIKRAFDYVAETYSKQFTDGRIGWTSYKEISTLVQQNAPASHDEFKRRFADLLDPVIVAKESNPVDVAKDFLKFLKEPK